jgi:hypothetical protein
MMKVHLAIGLGTLIALSPFAALAQTEGAAQPLQVAQAAPAAPNSAHAGGGGSHRRHLRHSANSHKERARAGAEHMRQMRMGTAPKTLSVLARRFQRAARLLAAGRHPFASRKITSL